MMPRIGAVFGPVEFNSDAHGWELGHSAVLQKTIRRPLGVRADLFMGELRKDYLTDRLVIISEERARRPTDFKTAGKLRPKAKCPFCPGNESMTPPAELVLFQSGDARLVLEGEEAEHAQSWLVRTFKNMFPVVSTETAVTHRRGPLFREPAYGYHYIMVATPVHEQAFSEIGVEQWVNVLRSLQHMVKWLYRQGGVSQVIPFINHGEEAGASLLHPHLQIVTLPLTPPLMEQEAHAVERSFRETGLCPMCSILRMESRGVRRLIATRYFASFCPWAPTHSFEYWIWPKRHEDDFLEAPLEELTDLALIMKSTLTGMSESLKQPPFNLIFHIPSAEATSAKVHWHVEVYPRLAKWAGLERGARVYVNQVSPESAARLLRETSAKELSRLVKNSRLD